MLEELSARVKAAAYTHLTDLQVTEPPDGPIVRMLHVPAPLDVVLAALRDPEGSIAFPLPIVFTKEEVEQGKIDRGAVIVAGGCLPMPA